MSSVTRTSARRGHNPQEMAKRRHAALYSTKKPSSVLLRDLTAALKSIDTHGSIEVYIQDSQVTQITTRNIQKTNGFNTHT